DQVEPAVPVEIDEAAGGAPARLLDPGRARHLLEAEPAAVGPAAAVAEQPSPAVLRDVDVHPTVVVEVADGDAHAVAGDVEAGALADVPEGAGGALAEEAVAGRGVGPPVVDEVDVEPAVVVEVEQGDAGAHDLRHEVAADRARLVAEVKAGRGRNLFKPRRFGPGFLGRNRAEAPAAGEQAKKGPECGEPGAEKSHALHERLFRACPDYLFRGGPSIRNGFRSFTSAEISTLNGVEAELAYFAGRMPAVVPLA